MIAAIGTDGMRAVVWGLGETEDEARADAAKYLGGDQEPLTFAPITEVQAAVIAGGDVSWPVNARSRAARTARGRQQTTVTLSVEANALLSAMAERRGASRSDVVEELVLAHRDEE